MLMSPQGLRRPAGPSAFPQDQPGKAQPDYPPCCPAPPFIRSQINSPSTATFSGAFSLISTTMCSIL